ncbi:MAG: acetyl-CoA C-acyltransferase, partial [Desulfatiglandales bacterium]
MDDAIIVTGLRTPIGRFMGCFKEIPAYDLAAIVLNGIVKKVGIRPEEIDHVILGQSYQSGEHVNIAKMALLKEG